MDDLVQALRYSFSGSPEEIEAAEQMLLSVNLNDGVCGELFRIAMDCRIEKGVRAAALLRIINIIRTVWSQELSRQTKDIVIHGFITLCLDCDEDFRGLMSEMCNCLVRVCFDTPESAWIQSALRFETFASDCEKTKLVTLLVSNSLADYLKDHFSKGEQLFRAFADGYYRSVLEYFVVSQSECHLALIFLTTYKIMHRKRSDDIDEDPSVIQIMMKRMNMLESNNRKLKKSILKWTCYTSRCYCGEMECDGLPVLLNLVMNLMNTQEHPSVRCLAAKTFVSLLRLQVVWASIEKSLQNFMSWMVGMFALSPVDVHNAHENPEQFILDNFDTSLSLYTLKGCAQLIASEMCSISKEFTVLMLRMIMEYSKCQDEKLVFAIFHMASSAVLNSVFDCTPLLPMTESGSLFIRSAVFNIIAHSNQDYSEDLMRCILAHLCDPAPVVRFFVISAFSSLIQKCPCISDIREHCVPYIHDIFTAFLDVIAFCFEKTLVSAVDSFFKVFGDDVIPWAEPFLNVLIDKFFELSVSPLENEYAMRISTVICEVLTKVNGIGETRLVSCVVARLIESFPDEPIYQAGVMEMIQAAIDSSTVIESYFWDALNAIRMHVIHSGNVCVANEEALLTSLLVKQRSVGVPEGQICEAFERARSIAECEMDISFRMLSSLIFGCFENRDLSSEISRSVMPLVVAGVKENIPEVTKLMASILSCHPELILGEETLLQYFLDYAELPHIGAIIPAMCSLSPEQNMQILGIITDRLRDCDCDDFDVVTFRELQIAEIVRNFANQLEILRSQHPDLFARYSEMTFPFLEETMPQILAQVSATSS